MTNNEIRITIAEKCGWKWYVCKQLTTYTFTNKPIPIDSVYFWEPTEKPSGEVAIMAPDYLNDLNAMHEAEKGLNRDQCAQYNVTLCRIVIPLNHLFPPYTSEEYPAYQYLFNATAAQRAEAFLRTIGKWSAIETKEEKK